MVGVNNKLLIIGLRLLCVTCLFSYAHFACAATKYYYLSRSSHFPEKFYASGEAACMAQAAEIAAHSIWTDVSYISPANPDRIGKCWGIGRFTDGVCANQTCSPAVFSGVVISICSDNKVWKGAEGSAGVSNCVESKVLPAKIPAIR